MADTNSRTAPESTGADGEASRPRDPAASEIRTRGPVLFGKYELLQRVRVGGMAEVYRAREPSRPDQLLAIKRVLPSFTDEADYVAMFIDEAQLSARLQHRCIAAAIELGRVEDEFYLALEYVDGLDVGVLLRRARARVEPMPVAVACLIAREVCAALEYAHDLCDEQGAPLGIVHRDVSPQNVLVSFAGDVKLIDFGIAKSTEQRMRTAAGLLKGKYGYLSPEQAQGHEVDCRSDLFSLGVCLYEMLSAQRLFFGSTDFSTIGRVRRAEIPPLRGFAPDVPEELVAIVERALARDCNARFQNAAELGAALDAFVERSGLRCERAELGEFVRAAADDPQSGPLAAPEGKGGDTGTGLLDAFDDVEPVSAVSVLAEAPAPAPLSFPDDPSELYDTLPQEQLAEPQHPEAVRTQERRAGTQPRGDATGEDLLEELSVDEPTHVVPYDAAPANAAESADAAQVEPAAASDEGAIAPDQTGEAVAADPAADGSETEAAAPAAAPAAAVAHHATTLPGIGMEWDDEELSTQLYDPPEPGQSGPGPVSGSLSLPRSTPPPVAPFAPAPSFPPPGSVSAAEVLSQAASATSAPPGARSSSGRPGASASLPPLSGLSTLPPAGRVGLLLPRTGLAVWAVAAGLALAAVGVPLALWVTRAPVRGMINLTATPPDAIVKLDGVSRGEHMSPFVLDDVAPDVSHEIEVSKPGYRTWSARLKIAPGQTVELPHVDLAPVPAAAPPASPAAPSVAPAPSRPTRGAALRTPVGEPSAPVERARPEPIAPRPRPAQVVAPRPHPPAPNAVTPPREAPAEPPPARVAEPHEAAPIAAAPASAAAAADGATGTLRINSRPWSRVYVDGRLIGTTPQMKITLGAGLHTVTLVNPDFGLQQVLSVQIAAGQTITKIVELGN